MNTSTKLKIKPTAVVEAAAASAAVQPEKKSRTPSVRRPLADRLASAEAALASFDDKVAEQRAKLETRVSNLRAATTVLDPETVETVIAEQGGLAQAEAAARKLAAAIKLFRANQRADAARTDNA